RVLAGFEILVRAADKARSFHARPVPREGAVAIVEAVADLRVGEDPARARHRAPVDDALVVGDVDALRGGAARTDDDVVARRGQIIDAAAATEQRENGEEALPSGRGAHAS